MTDKEKSALQKEIVDSLDINSFGRLLLAPRVGKTKVIIDVIKRDKPKSILWVTPSEKLAEEDIPAEFIKWKAKRFINKLSTSTWMSLHKVKGDYDLIVLDEDQFATENNLVTLLDGTLKGRILSMTGTSTKHDIKLDLYKRLRLKTLYKITINDAVDVGLLANYSIKVVQVDMDIRKNYPAGNEKKRFLTTEDANYNYLSKMVDTTIGQKKKFRILTRMRAIQNSPSKLGAAKYIINSLKGRRLIFSGSVKQAEELCDHVYHNKTDNKDLVKFIDGSVDRIAMVNKGGTGFTYKVIQHLILVQSDSDKNGLTSQKICRTLLSQKDYEATIWMVCLMGTQDEVWVDSALQSFDESKIEYIKFKDLEL